MLLAQSLVFAVAFAVCAWLGGKPGAMRQAMAYIGSIGLMVAVLGTVGAILLGRIDAKGYVMFFVGMLLGATVGVAAGIFLAKWAANNLWVYATVMMVDAGAMVLAPIIVARIS